MINKKIINSIYIFLFLTFFTLHFYQLSTQHWSGVLDQDLIIIYNSILLNSGIEQEYRDHPAFTTFLLNSFFYKILLLFLDIPSQIDIIFNSRHFWMTRNILLNRVQAHSYKTYIYTFLLFLVFK